MGLERGNLNKFFTVWEHVLKAVPDAKRLALHEMGKSVMSDVEGQIIAQGVNDSNYHVRRWQRPNIGNGLGYVAVRPVSEAIPGKGITARQLTRYLEKGHGARKPSGKSQRYRARIVGAGIGAKGNAYVKARQFYAWARMDAQDHAERAADHVLIQLENAFDL